MQLCFKANTNLHRLETSKVTLLPDIIFENIVQWGDTLLSAKSIPGDIPTGLYWLQQSLNLGLGFSCVVFCSTEQTPSTRSIENKELAFWWLRLHAFMEVRKVRDCVPFVWSNAFYLKSI